MGGEMILGYIDTAELSAETRPRLPSFKLHSYAVCTWTRNNAKCEQT